MKYTDLFKIALKKCVDNPTDTTSFGELSSSYWSMIIETMGDVAREKGDLRQFLTEESDLVSYGLCKEMLPKINEVRPLHGSPS